LRNGTGFVAVVPLSEVDPAVWDPHQYAHGAAEHPPLRELVHAQKPSRRKPSTSSNVAPFAPIEYRHIPPRVYGTFSFDATDPASQRSSFPAVKGGTLLFGTMRAYLGNVLVTPDPTWLGLPSETRYSVKSEFLVIEPLDGLVYYWAALLRSPAFLHRLPPGGGGTRPRLDADGLLRLPIEPAEPGTRRATDKTLRELAEREWQLLVERQHALHAIES
jgi:hypothetical protein